MEIEGTYSGRLADNDGKTLPFEVTLTTHVSSGGPVRVSELILSGIDGKADITAEVLRELADCLEDFADHGAANSIAKWHAKTGTPIELRLDSTTSLKIDGISRIKAESSNRALVVGPRHVKEIQAELARRRRAPRIHDRYVQVAELYKNAKAKRSPVREYIASELFVGKSTAEKLIAETRRRGLLPPGLPGRPGRSQDAREEN